MTIFREKIHHISLESGISISLHIILRRGNWLSDLSNLPKASKSVIKRWSTMCTLIVPWGQETFDYDPCELSHRNTVREPAVWPCSVVCMPACCKLVSCKCWSLLNCRLKARIRRCYSVWWIPGVVVFFSLLTPTKSLFRNKLASTFCIICAIKVYKWPF